MAVSEAVLKALDLLNKQFPKAPLCTLGQAPRARVESFSTGSLILDQLFGIGGWPRGRMVHLYGKPHAGKTTLCQHAIASVQQQGELAAFIDTEHRASLEYAAALGVDVENLVFDQPSGGKEAIDKIVSMLESKLFRLIVLDSLAHTKPKSIADGSIEAANVGSHAKFVTNALDRIGKLLDQCTVIFTNHIRKDPSGYGSGEFTPGGEAPKFDCDLAVRLNSATAVKDEEEMPTHNVVTAKVYKNSVGGIPYRSAEFVIRFGQGVAIGDDTLDAGVLAGVIQTTTNGFYSIQHNGKKISIGHGREAALYWLQAKEHRRTEAIRKQIKESIWFKGKEPSTSQEGSLIQGDGGILETA